MLLTKPRSAKLFSCAAVLLLLAPSSFPSSVPAAGVFKNSTDVGLTLPGSTTFDPMTSSYRVSGGGADMWGGADAFHFSWKKMKGDATLAADVHFADGAAAPKAKAVLIFRQSLDPGSPYADVAIHGDGHITLQWRSDPGGPSEDLTSPAGGATRLRIERRGNVFTVSAGGVDGRQDALKPLKLSLRGPVYVGLGVCSHDASGVQTVTFSNVLLSKGAQ